MADEKDRYTPGVSWKTVLLSAVLGVLGTVVATLIISRIQSREPALTYTVAGSVPFSGQNGALSVYQTRVVNSGKVEVDDVVISVKVPWGHLEQSRASAPPGLNFSEARQADSITVTVPNLNPSEAIQVALVASSPSGSLPEKPDISVRGRGVSGHMASDSNPGVESSPFWTALSYSLAAVSLTLALFATFRIYKTRKDLSTEGFSPDERGHSQRYVLAYLCRLSGLQELGDGYLERTAETAYWAECDRLGSLAIEDESLRNQIADVLKRLPEYASSMSDNAKAVALYNLARIEAFAGEYQTCKEHIAAASALSPKEISVRLKLDRLVADAQQFIPM